MLESTLPHETQKQLQNSLQTTPRLPIKDEPSKCTQEAVDSDVTARRTNGMVETAKPNESDVDVDGKATLGREPAGMVHRVDEGGKECKSQLQLQQTIFYSKEDVQHIRITNKDVPSAQKLLLKGEWTVCTSSELLTTMVEPYANDGDGNACVYLGGTRWRAGDASRSKGQSDVLRGSTDLLRVWTDTLNVSDSAETAVVSHGKGAGTYLGTGDVKCAIYETDGVGSHTDTSTGQTDAPSIKMNAIKPANESETVRLP